MKEATILFLLEHINQIKLQHWNTTSYAQHKTLGNLYDKLNELMDEFVETMMGKFDRPDFPESFPIEFTKPESVDLMQFLTGFSEFLISMSDTLDPKLDSDLLNIRDEMLGAINQAKYLLTLK